MLIESLLPPNLGALGVPRKAPVGEADLITIWKTPYPVLTNYSILCNRCGLKLFGGGTAEKQGKRVPGYITSGYRLEIMNGNIHSPHRYAFAIDMIAGDINQQIIIGDEAINLFSRIGFYPDRGFMHLDLAPENWIARYNKARFWVMSKGKYRFFNTISKACEFALAA